MALWVVGMCLVCMGWGGYRLSGSVGICCVGMCLVCMGWGGYRLSGYVVMG